jgi:SNF2 family DNA or RNA helicase
VRPELTVLVHEPTNSLLLKVPDPFAIRELLPKSKILNVGDHNIVIKLTNDSTRVLRNIGIECPSPITAFYDWPGKWKPYDHQQVMAEFMTMNRRCFNLSDMGAMKTAATLWAADWLMKTGSVRRALVCAPLSNLELTWMTELFTVLMHRTGVVVHGGREKRMKALETPADFYLINHDGIAIKEMWETIKRTPEINLIIVDEGSKFRNPDTDKWRALDKMLRPDMRLWWLTGGPCPNAPTDVWAQCKLVNPIRVPKFAGAFKRSTMMQVATYKWQPRDDAYVTAYEAMQPAIRFKKKDVIDLPPMVTVNWQVKLSPEQKAAFKLMKNEMFMEQTKADKAGQQILAVNAADQINKCRQILCGAIKGPDGKYVHIPHKPRSDLLLDAIQSAAAKAVVIMPFKGILYEEEQALLKHYTVGVMNGDVTPPRRREIVNAFKNEKDPHVLLCHPQVMSHGLNLTEADVMVVYAPIYSNDDYTQMIERINRAGQKNKMTIIRFGAHPLEWEIYKSLDTRGTAQDNVLKLYRFIATSQVMETNDV